MPSLLEHLKGDGDAGPSPTAPSADLLDSVKADGSRRRTNRRRRNLAFAVLGLGLVAVPAATLSANGDSGRQDISVATDAGPVSLPELADDSMPFEIEPVPETIVPLPAPVDIVPQVAPATTVAATPGGTEPTAPPRTAPATTATPTLVCRNSTDPACGPFRWDPALLPDQPLVASFTKAPTTAVAGQPVAFEVSWSDGDAKLTYDRFSTDGTSLGSACSMVPRYGPWTPPERVAGSGTLAYGTTFAGPGTYTVAVTLGTGGAPGEIPRTVECSPPYGGAARIETTVTVTAAQPA